MCCEERSKSKKGSSSHRFAISVHSQLYYGLEMTPSSSSPSFRKYLIWQLQSLRVSFSVQYWDGCDWHFHHVNQMGFAVAAPGSTFDQKWKSESLSVADSLACRTSQQLSAKVFIRPHRTLLLELDTTFPVSIFSCPQQLNRWPCPLVGLLVRHH